MSSNFYKYPDICRLGSDENRDILAFNEDFIIVEEKFDGGNGCFYLNKDGLIHEQSRNRDLTEEKDEKTFIRQRLALRETLKGKELNPDYLYYIEWTAQHTISYTNAPHFIGFDIKLRHNAANEGLGLFVGRETKEQEFARLGIECIPLVWKGTANELKKLEITSLIGKSKYYNGYMEGVCIKNYSRKDSFGHQLMAKVVRDEFKEANKCVFGGIKHPDSDTCKIVEQFATEARARKMINYLTKEEGLKLEMALMKYLPTRLAKDILKEEFSSIYENYKFLDFKEFKMRIMKICLLVLQEEIAKQALKEPVSNAAQ